MIVGQGAPGQGIITGQGAVVPGIGAGQGANSSGEKVQGIGIAAIAGLAGEKSKYPERFQEDGKKGEQVMLESGDEVDMADLSKDIFMVDDEKFPPGNYYNVKAGRQVMRGRSEREMGNAPDPGRRRECGFDLYGDDRVKGAVMRYRMDCNVTMSLSFNPANMVCEGCEKRGKHSLIGKDPMILVATDQNFPATLYSADEKACIAVMRVEHGTMKEISFAVADMQDGVEVPMGSIILVGSVSDLDSQGVSGYSEELARTMRILSEKLGNSFRWWHYRLYCWEASTARGWCELSLRRSFGRRGWTDLTTLF